MATFIVQLYARRRSPEWMELLGNEASHASALIAGEKA